MDHGSYFTKELTNNENVSKETGIKKVILDSVDSFVKQQGEGINYNELAKDSILVVCKNMTIGYESKVNLNAKIEEISKVHEEKNLYLVLENCTVNYNDLPEGSNIKVLDLRGNTKFQSSLAGAATVEKVLLRNNTNNTANQLWLSACGKLGPIYQLSDDDSKMSGHRIYLSGCRFADNFKFVNLNSCCTKLLNRWCLDQCKCLAVRLPDILKSFDEKSQPPKIDLRGE